VHAVKGTLVHRTLELLFCQPPERRTVEAALTALDRAATEGQDDPEWALLGLTDDAEQALVDEAETLTRRYFTMEDPRTVRDIGLELRLEVQVGDVALRGIIDRLELDGDGELVVTDYKTGRPPSRNFEQRRLGGVHFYAFLCERLFGKRPARVQLLYLSTGEVIETRPSEQSINYLPKRTAAIMQAVARACDTDDFRPRPGGLCGFCAYKPWCPAFGGDPARAATEAPVVLGAVAA
jgi:putative RecB family exonuclease